MWPAMAIQNQPHQSYLVGAGQEIRTQFSGPKGLVLAHCASAPLFVAQSADDPKAVGET